MKCAAVQWRTRQGRQAEFLRRTKLNQDNNRSERRWLLHLHIYWSHASNHDRCYVLKYGIMMKFGNSGQGKSMRCYYSLSFIERWPQPHTWGMSRGLSEGQTPQIFLIFHSIHLIRWTARRQKIVVVCVENAFLICWFILSFIHCWIQCLWNAWH